MGVMSNMRNKFIKIYDDLSNQIINREIEAETLLPSENELAETYSSSRETIRKALNKLSEDGYIHKVQGKGSIVLDVSRVDFPVSGLTSFKELSKKMSKRTKTHVENLEKMEPASMYRDILKLSPGEKVWKVTRTREIDGERIILDRDYLSCRSIPNLTHEICQDSIYEYIENTLGLCISFAKKEITIEEPTEEDLHYLDFKGFNSIVVVKNFVYLDDASLFQYTESRHRPDKFRFVDFARRNQKTK